MFLTVHATAGIAIGSAITNPLGAFFIGLASHLILDIIPHGDENFKDTSITGMAKKAAADHLGIVLNIFVLWQFFSVELFTLAVIAGCIGAMLPDYLMGVYRLTAGKHLLLLTYIHRVIKPFEDFHHYCHMDIIKHEVSITAGFILQTVTLVALWLTFI